MHAAIAGGDGTQVIHCISVYGFAGAASNKMRMGENEHLLALLFQAVNAYGDVPIVIMGDVNVPPELSMNIQSAIMSGGWCDTADMIAKARNEQPCPTCYVRDTSPGSRIDVILCNRIAKQFLHDFGVLLDSGIPTHLPIAAIFSFDTYTQHVRRVARPMRIPLD